MSHELTIINPQIPLRSLSLFLSVTKSIRGAFYCTVNSKMRILFFISLLFLSNSAWSQPWQDALKNARESYVSKAYEQSALHYQRAQKLAPKNIDLSVELAQSLYKAGKYEEAEKLYNSQVAKSRYLGCN